MRTRTLGSLVMVLSALAGCATTQPARGPHTNASASTATSVALPTIADSAAAEAVSTALACMLSASADTDRCAHLAAQATVPPDALTHATPYAIEQINEYVHTRARAERLPQGTRAALSRWFDLAAGAVQEALTARQGAQCQNVEACAAHAGGHPEIGDLEEASRWDTRAVSARTQLMSLFRFAQDAGELSGDVEASALLVLAHRVETAERARPEVRADTLRAMIDTVRDLGGDVPDAPPPGASTDSARARDVNPIDALAPARVLLRDRLTAALPRVTQARVRAAAQQALAAQTR